MRNRSAFVDYQQRATEFDVGDLVYPFLSGTSDIVGRVVAVWPAIGMVDVEWPHGSQRFPVEELQKHLPGKYDAPDIDHDTVPGGNGTVSVPGGPLPSSTRVAAAWIKKALYWAAPDRHYKASTEEVEKGAFHCPRCKEAELRATSYKRSGGASERLLACPSCLFLIKKCDIIGHPDYLSDEDLARKDKQPFARIRLGAGGGA
jgi:hypothetical protein